MNDNIIWWFFFKILSKGKKPNMKKIKNENLLEIFPYFGKYLMIFKL